MIVQEAAGPAEVEEDFDFPAKAALFNPNTQEAFGLRLERRVYARSRTVVQTPTASEMVFEYQTSSRVFEAVLLRSAWVRPVGELRPELPIQARVFVDHVLTLNEPWSEHLRGGSAAPPRPCLCNGWSDFLSCSCRLTPLRRGIGKDCCLFPALGYEDGHALPDRPLGIFAPHGSLVQIKIDVPGSLPEPFEVRCGITAALYACPPEARKA